MRGEDSMNLEENILGTEKISKLMKKFSIPCIISLLVNSLYNIVDQVFIGWGVGYLGNGATNVVFPLNMICLAFALMLGDGAAAYLSLKLGERKKKEAGIGVGNGITLSIIISLLFGICILLFLPQILNLFGCTDALRKYALSYGYIITIGLPFMMIGITFNSIIRADGNPKYAMKSMVIGAILNLILDPIFIFVMHWGVTGAAIATVISQFVTFVLNLMYIKKFQSISVTREMFHLEKNISKKITTLGISSFITQMSIVFVIACENNLLVQYGATSRFGAEIPITVLGIVMKLSQILNSIIIGLAAGCAPILGYNYGAGKYDRVKKTLKNILIISLMVSSVALLLFQTIPDKLILLFGNGNDLYIEFACLSFRIYLLLVICNGIQIPSGIFFQAIGKSGKSAILSLSRQIIFLIPAMIILGRIFGVIGVLWAGPLADGLAFLLSTSFLITEMKHLGKENVRREMYFANENNVIAPKEHFVITISREYGSGGRYIGSLVAKELGIKCYDKEIIKKLAQKTGLSEEYIENNEQKRYQLASLNNHYYYNFSNSDELFIEESKLIQKIAKQESCVIIGRCADFILKDQENVIKIFVYSSMKDKVKRATQYYGMKKNEAEKEIKRINKLRANHYKHYTDREWKDPNNYDLCINSNLFSVEQTAKLIAEIVSKK